MDLRGFDDKRTGCLYEIGRLAEHAGSRPIVLVSNKHTKLDLVEPVFFDAARRRPATAESQVFVLPAGPSDRATVETAIALLLHARTE
jgi:hypothetical protein